CFRSESERVPKPVGQLKNSASASSLTSPLNTLLLPNNKLGSWSWSPVPSNKCAKAGLTSVP
ncbi:MAG: hypothetical protein ACKPKO_12815, partial [Candidatus Fonsibacter sp.]